jgi:hypothetical protein
VAYWRIVAAMPCLDESTVLAFVQGTLTSDIRTAAENHIDECAACNELVALCATGSRATTRDARSDGDGPLTSGESAPIRERVIDGRFRLQALAGSGAMGRVYRATDLESGERVALKMLRDAGRNDERRFEREARVLASVVHPHVVRYIAHGRAASLRYLVMEWLEGEDLRHRLLRGPMTVDEALQMALRAADGLGRLTLMAPCTVTSNPATCFSSVGASIRARSMGTCTT